MLPRRNFMFVATKAPLQKAAKIHSTANRVLPLPGRPVKIWISDMLLNNLIKIKVQYNGQLKQHTRQNKCYKKITYLTKKPE